MWYGADFGPDEISVLQWVCLYVALGGRGTSIAVASLALKYFSFALTLVFQILESMTPGSDLQLALGRLLACASAQEVGSNARICVEYRDYDWTSNAKP